MEGKPPPAQQADGQHAAAEDTAQGQKQQQHPQEPPAGAKGRQHHQHRGAELAQRMGQKAHTRKKNGGGIGGSQCSGEGKPRPVQHLAGQPGGGQQQQIIDREIQ
ncbi:hypothetical protein SDC9_75008 [bioreactor metagenome]|uniref:Uncharacterized protein n=1 Tax=bioreactor metagenome TaxID=1076179 RepID=A0A644YIM0_9ZZZZ